MANTKSITDRAMRKGIKRSQRKRLKELFGTLNRKERAALRKEPTGVRKFVAENRNTEDE